MSRSLATRWQLAAILAVALVLRLAAGGWWQQRLPPGQKFGFGDSEGYWELGRTIARGQRYSYGPEGYRVFRTPGYPTLLAGLFLLRREPPVLWGRVLSAVLGTAAVGLVAWLAWLLFDPRTAVVAAAIAAIFPEAIAAGAFILSEAPFAPLMVLNLVLWTLAWRAAGNDRVGWSLAAGMAAGLATLVRPSWLLFVPFAAAAGVALGPDRRKQAAVGGLILVGLALTMAPWWVRNYLVAGRFVPTSLQVGASLYDGLSPMATGASDMQFVPGFVAEQHAADSQPGADLRGLFEDRLDRRMRDASLDWARSNPGRAAQLVAIKFVRMWNVWPNAAEFQSAALRLLLAATYTPIIVFALVGVWRYARRDWPYLLCLLPAVYFTCLHVVFVSSIRYRQPAMLALIVLAAAVVAGTIVRGSATTDKRQLTTDK